MTPNRFISNPCKMYFCLMYDIMKYRTLAEREERSTLSNFKMQSYKSYFHEIFARLKNLSNHHFCNVGVTQMLKVESFHLIHMNTSANFYSNS